MPDLVDLTVPVTLTVVDNVARSAQVVAVIETHAALAAAAVVLERVPPLPQRTLAFPVRDASGRTVHVTRESVEELLDASVSHLLMLARLKGPRRLTEPASRVA